MEFSSLTQCDVVVFLSASRPYNIGSAFNAFRLLYDFWRHHPVYCLVTNVRLSKLLAHTDIEHPLSNRSMLETLGSPLLRFGFLTPQFMSQTNCTKENCMAAIRRVARNFLVGLKQQSSLNIEMFNDPCF